MSNDQFARFVAATGYVTVAERAPDPTRLAGAPPELLRPGALVFPVPRKLDGPPDPLPCMDIFMCGGMHRQEQRIYHVSAGRCTARCERTGRQE